jgi:hypothetical protein
MNGEDAKHGEMRRNTMEDLTNPTPEQKEYYAALYSCDVERVRRTQRYRRWQRLLPDRIDDLDAQVQEAIEGIRAGEHPLPDFLRKSGQ